MTALSYSAWGTYHKCPAKYEYSYIQRLPRQPPGPALVRGTEIHDGIESFLNGTTDQVPRAIRGQYGQWFEGLRSNFLCRPEFKWAVNSNWELCNYDDEDTQWRGYIDLILDPVESDPAVNGYEWKTGGIYDEHVYQSDLYGSIALIAHPEASLAKITRVYVDKNKSHWNEYKREDLEGMKVLWNQRHKEVCREQDYIPTPGFYCRWCDFSKQNNGPCRF